MQASDTDIGILNIRGATTIHLGRSPDNDRELDHPAVSAYHARLEKHPDGTWWVTDLNSTHGTFVNNRHVGKEGLPVVPEVDTLWIAPFVLKLSEEQLPKAPAATHLRMDLVNLERKVGSRILLDLKGTPLSFRPGEFIAVVGGSGAGKSTFLKALLGMDTIQGRGRSGDVFFNNQQLISGADSFAFDPLNSIVGYVPQQDDSLHFQLTPLEAMDYTARLRYANDYPASERKERVKNALAAVRLEREELQKKEISRLSGGQRKRVNVAMELVADPRLIFLDEPTSGLDPGLDLEMMGLLRDWTKGDDQQDQKTIVLITHATEHVRLCDYVVFMGRVIENQQERGGCVLYFGHPGADASRFFEQTTFSEIYRSVDDPVTAAGYHAKLLSDPEWKTRLWARARTPEEIRQTRNLQGDGSEKPQKISNWKKWREQFKILSSRYLKLLTRDRSAFYFQLAQGVLVALLLWGVSDVTAFSIVGVRDAPTTLFILSIAAVWLGILNASKEIVKERRIYGRERRYGVGPIPYVLSKLFVLGGLGILQMATLLALTLFWFQPETGSGILGRFVPISVEWFVSLMLLLLSGLALGFVISAFSKSMDQATLLMFPAMLIQVLFSGLLFEVGPLTWFAFTHWGLRALGTSLNLPELYAASGKANEPILDKLNFAGGGASLLGFWLILVVFIVGCVLLTIWRQSWQDKARIPED